MGLISKIKNSITNVVSNTSKGLFLSFDYKSPSGGYMNYAIYSVTGINSSTNRKNTRKYECKNENEAMQLATADGLINIDNIKPLPFDPPTERQIEACKKHFRIIPPNSCMNDISFLMTKDINGEEDAPIELIKQADSMGIKFSYLAGKQTLEQLIKKHNQ